MNPEFIAFIDLLRLYIPYIITAGVFFVVIGSVIRKVSVRRSLGAITNQKKPPQELSIAEMGTLIDGVVHQRDLTAQILSFAQQGFFIIEETSTSRFWQTGEYVLHKKNNGDFEALRSYEKEIITDLFKDGESISIQRAGKIIASKLESIEDGIYTYLVQQKLYKSKPSTFRKRKIIWSTTVLLLFLSYGLLTFQYFQEVPTLSFWLLLVLTVIILIVYLLKTSALTKKGMKENHFLLGYRDYLIMCKDNQLGKEAFEDHVPSALMLDVMQTWAQKFRNKDIDVPSWFLPHKDEEKISSVLLISHIESFANKFQASVFGKSNPFESLTKYVLQTGFSDEERIEG